MPKGYWIANVDVHDSAVYEKYRAANAKPFADFGAKFLVRGAAPDIREGASHPRVVVIEFELFMHHPRFKAQGWEPLLKLRVKIGHLEG